MKSSRYTDWRPFFGNMTPMVAAGPCSAESISQVMDTAESLAKAGIGLFRAGVWKPRTRPGNFEGAGEPALEWLSHVKVRTGMRVATEVATPAHVETALKYGIDVFWIGARTVTNPFMVQDIADSLRGTGMPVLVKNPMTADLGLWLGAFERLSSAGLSVLGAIHRGVPSFCPGTFRNDPRWDMAIDLRIRMPELMILCDPSHMTGNAEYVREVSEMALKLDLDGLFVESHCCPSMAKSDAAQQLTPSQLSEMISGLVVPDTDLSSKPYAQSIEQLRARIDEIDDAIIAQLAMRMEVSAQIGEFKKANNVAVLQASRWDEVMSKVLRRASESGLERKFVEDIFSRIHAESIDRQSSGNK